MKKLRIMMTCAAVFVPTACFAIYYRITVPNVEAPQEAMFRAQEAMFRAFDGLESQKAYIVNEDGDNLGYIARSGSNALGNEYSKGNKFDSDSIFNEYGKYGNKFASTSAFCSTATKPPTIVVESSGKLYEVGLLTTNKYAQTQGQRINPYALQSWLKAR